MAHRDAPGLAPRDWDRGFLLTLRRGVLQLLLLPGECRRDRALPFAAEIFGVLLVDVLLLFRRRIRPRDVEMPVLHEVEIAVAAAHLAPRRKFHAAFGELRGFGFPARGLVGSLGTLLIIGGRPRAPPLGMRARRRQHDAADDGGIQQRGFTWTDHGRPFQGRAPANYRLWAA